MTAIVGFSWIAVGGLGGLIDFAVFYGFFSGSFVSLTPVVWAAICPNMKVFGTRVGMMAVCMATGLLVGNPIAGALIKGDDFVPLQTFCGATVAVAGIMLILARLAKSGLALSVKV